MFISDINKRLIKDKLFDVLIQKHPHQIKKYKKKYDSYVNRLYSTHMKGGSRIIKYLDEEYEFVNIDENSENEINIYLLQAKDTDSSCILLTINKNDSVATLDNLSTDGIKCSNNLSTNIGSHMIKIMIKFIKKYFKYINAVQLVDHSYILCNSKLHIYLGNMMVLKTGHTFYGREGFRPYEPDNKQESKELNIAYNNNIKIMDKLTINQSNVCKYTHKYINKTNNKNKQIKTIYEYAMKHPDVKFTKLFEKIFTHELFDELCDFINYISLKVISHTGLTNFNNKKFILYL